MVELIPAGEPRPEWRVQWYSRNGVDAPERAEGHQDFDDEAEARHFLAVNGPSRVGPHWRVALECRRPAPPWRHVDGLGYTGPLDRHPCCAEFARTGHAHTEACCYLGEDL